MNDVKEVIGKISGRNNKECYQELRCAVEIVLEYLPDSPKMKVVQEEIVRRIGKQTNTTAVAKALSRAARDIWEYGDRENLEAVFGHSLKEAPSAKGLILTLAEYVYDEVTYSKWASYPTDGKGIYGRSRRQSVMAAPVTEEGELLERLIVLLNQRQVPITEFMDRFLNGSLGELLGEGGETVQK